MKIKQKIIVIFTLFIYVASLFVPLVQSIPIVFAEDTGAVTLNIRTADPSGRLEYLTGEKIGTEIDLGYSGQMSDFNNSVLTIKIRADHLAVDSVDDLFSRSPLASRWEKENPSPGQNYYIARYYFEPNEDGENPLGTNVFKRPFSFSWNQGTTPKGHQTDIIVELERPGQPISRKELVYTANINPARFYHNVETTSGNTRTRAFIDGKSVMESGVSIPTNVNPIPTNTPDDTSTWARYVIGLDSAVNTYGNYTPQIAVITYKLPEGGKLRGTGTYSGGGKDFTWVYDSLTHTAIYKGPLTDAQTAYIELDFPNQPYATIHTSSASLVVDGGTVNEFSYSVIDEHVKWTPARPAPPTPTPPGQNGHFMIKTIRYGVGGPNNGGYYGQPNNGDTGIVWQPGVSSAEVAKVNHIQANVLFVGVSQNNPAYTYVKEFVETEIDPRLYFVKWEISSSDYARTNPDIVRIGYDVYGIKETGEQVLIAENVNRLTGEVIDPETGLPDTAGKFKQLKIVFNESIKLGIRDRDVWSYAFRVDLVTAVKPDIWNAWNVEDLVYADSRGTDRGIPPLESPHRMYAAATFVTYYAGENGENPTTQSNQIPNRTRGEAGAGAGYARVSTFYKGARTEIGSWNGDDQIVDTTGTLEDAFMIKGDLDVLNPNDRSRLDVENARLITLLPPGLDFVPDSETNGYAGKAIVKYDYKGTGKIAVIIPFDTVSKDENNGQSTSGAWHARNVERYVEFKVIPTNDLEYGNNPVLQYLVWDNNKDVLPPANATRSQKKSYTDILDLDDDGDVTEVFLEGTNNVLYNPQLAVGLRKHISEDKVNWKTKISNLLDIGTEFYYRLSLANRFATPVNQASIIDVLPSVGDKRIVANDAGNYGNRNSVFSVHLSGALENVIENADFFTKWDAFYSEELQGNTTDETIDKTFVSADAITDWSKVKMVKLSLKSGQIIQGGEKADVIIPAKIPLRSDLALFDQANNTAAFQTSMIDNNYREVSLVSVPVARYAITGVTFHDSNKDGDKDRNEPVLSGYTVQLMNEADDTPVIDPVTNQPVTAVTDGNGVYKLDVFKRGRYYIKVLKKEETETFTRIYEERGQVKSGTSSVKDGVIGNDTSEIDSKAGRTVAFDLNPSVIPAGLVNQSRAQRANTLATEDNTLFAVRNIGFENITVDVDITVTKSWDDVNNQDGKRPSSITVNLFANGNKVDTATISDNAGIWSHTFTDKPKYANGREIVYTVEEDTVTDYTAVVTGNVTTGFIITNSYTPEVVEVPVQKIWDDANNQDGKRPSNLTVVVTKTVDGVTSDTTYTTVLSGTDNEWTYTFTGLPKYEAGKLITYGVKEVTVPTGYISQVSGTTITNSYTPEVIQIVGSKTWNDENNQDGKRPESIIINLLADGVEVQEKVVTEGHGWTYNFTDLPKYVNGREIVYTITEDSVNLYNTVVNGFNITNTYSPEKIIITGNKTWNDANNQDGKRPKSITVILYADGVIKDTKVVDSTTNWSYEFTDLPRYDNAHEIVYTIDEEDVVGYTKSISGYNLINSYVPENRVVTGEKIWDDANNQDGKRPTFITVRLFANGEEISNLKVDDTEDWKYAFKDLPRYKNGQEIAYSVEEDEVEGYTTIINGFDITNSYTPEVLTVFGKKLWNDDFDQDGIRPESIIVNLLANGEKVTDVKVSSDINDNWIYEFKNLPKFDKGNQIVYTVTENAVEGYVTTVDGTTITNTHQPIKTSIKVIKLWNDDNDKSQKRSTSIAVQLVADGKEVKDQILILNSDNNWQADFTDLDKNKNGKEIVYTVKEVTVPKGYTSTVEIKDGVVTIMNTYIDKSEEKILPQTGQSGSELVLFGFVLLSIAFYLKKRNKF